MRRVADSPSASPSFPLHGLRQPFTVNHFKKTVLGARHRPGQPQAEEVMKVFLRVEMEGSPDRRTWTRWFKGPPRKAGRAAVAKLDGYFDQKGGLPRSMVVSPRAQGSTFYVDLIAGGLVGTLLQRTNAKPPIKALRNRAFDYEPTSSSHLHLDAIEIAALEYDVGEVTCDELKAVAAKRVLELIYDRWKPRQGSIYKELSSSLKIQWDGSDDEAREKIRRSFAQLIPNRFDVRMNEAPSPDWTEIGVSEGFAASDIHKVLFLMAADNRFLVGDRFDTWVLDLVSASVAAYALAQSNPYSWEPFGLSPTCRYWDAMRVLFFYDEPYSFFEEQLEQAFLLVGGIFNIDVERNLFAARTKYRDWLESLGLSARKISEMAHFEPLYPQVFVSGPAHGPRPS